MDGNMISDQDPNFQNPQIHLADIPRHEDVVYQPISPAYWNVILIRIFIRFLIFGALLLSLLLSIDALAAYRWPGIVAFSVFTGITIYWQRIAFPKRGFAIRKHDILYRRGVLSTVQTIIPFQRVQHVAVNESLLSRKYRLAQLQIFTAGGASSDIKISGLEKEDAERLKSQIMTHIVDIDADPIDAENPKPSQQPE